MKQCIKKSKLMLFFFSVLTVFILSTNAMAAESEYDSVDAVSFVFSNSGITTEDTTHTSAYAIDETSLTIKSAGTYIFSGSCGDGSITVKKGTTGVTLVLNGLTLTNTGTTNTATAPLVCNKSTGVTIVVNSGTTNTLADSIYNNDETYSTNEKAENAVIKCKDGSQVKITGSGKLTVTANGKNGIKSGTTDSVTDENNPRNAFLIIENATLNITANNNDAINAEQELNILSGTLNIRAEDDAIHSDYALTIGAKSTDGPTINITKAYEGIEAANISVFSGDIDIITTDDCINAANDDLSDYDFAITISGGDIYGYTTAGDGIDSNGELNISGGNVEIWSANTADNQPLDASGTINISGGTVFAAGGSNGMGTDLNATQNYITFGSTGVNQQQEQQGAQPGQQGEQQGTQQQIQQGGQPGQQGAQPGQQGEQQPSIGGQRVSIVSGNSVSVTDSNDSLLYSATAPCNACYVFFSCADIDSEETYTLKSGDNSVTQDTDDNNQNIQTFTDVKNDAYYYDAVLWAVSNGITYGTSATTFSPDETCTRSQMVSFLWRVAGCPEPTVTTCAFIDIEAGAYYEKAVLWAVEQGITAGTDATSFSPNQACTRGQVVTFIWRAKGKIETTNENPFTDVTQDDYFYNAVLWAEENGITYGVDATHFAPNTKCTRAQIVSFLYRAYK